MGGDFKHKTSNIRMPSPKLRAIFRPKSEIQTIYSSKIRWSPKKKKKKVFTKIDCDFSAGFVTFRLVGGMHPEMEPNYSKQRLIFRPKSLLLGWWGGMHPPHPPLNPPLVLSNKKDQNVPSLSPGQRNLAVAMTITKQLICFAENGD